MNIDEKLQILADGAKYDVSCSSSGGEENPGAIGCNKTSGICHSYTSDGRCVSLLKVLFTNFCIYDCSYCLSRSSNDIPRAAFSPRELADLTINFYKRNYIEGLFLSSGIIESEDHTMSLLIKALEILRFEHGFKGYIHLKLIPGSDPALIARAIKLATRVSSNLELPSSKSLQLLAPQKSHSSVLQPLKFAREFSLAAGRKKPIGMSTQMIIGATPESDFDILKTSSVMYERKLLKRVYYSAYIPVNSDTKLPALKTPPLKREHRLYQADWLLRFYGFSHGEILHKRKNLDMEFDPKTVWAFDHMELFPVEINAADREMLIRIPGIGIRGADKIIRARRHRALGFDELKKLRISLKRARYFITAKGRYYGVSRMYPEEIKKRLQSSSKRQLTLFDQATLFGEL